jgi:hypothetical protein
LWLNPEAAGYFHHEEHEGHKGLEKWEKLLA